MTWLYVLTGLSVAALIASITLGRLSARDWNILDFHGGADLAIMLSLIAAIVFAVLTTAKAVDQRNCGFAGDQYQRPTRWDFWAGCFIRLNDGRYLPLDQYRAFVGDRP